eukprot:6745968-Prymnesium_polylepis.1
MAAAATAVAGRGRAAAEDEKDDETSRRSEDGRRGALALAALPGVPLRTGLAAVTAASRRSAAHSRPSASSRLTQRSPA